MQRPEAFIKVYSPDAKIPKRRAAYRNIVEELEKGTVISKIAKEYGITRQTIYRIKKDNASSPHIQFKSDE